jgi:indole-3-glycerol phosphate synthase
VNRSARGEPDLLARIVQAKREELADLLPRMTQLMHAAEAAPPLRPFGAALRSGSRVTLIAEFKRRSPSAGELGGTAGAADAARAYQAAGATAMSVLTDARYFGGSLEDLRAARAASTLPVLRKDFVIHSAQVFEARANGADAVLLIVRILDDDELRELFAAAGDVGIDALVEVHDDAELERALVSGAGLIGINNRDLATFRTDLDVTMRLADRVPPDRTLVAESGIRTAADVELLASAGVDAILVGEALMRAVPQSAGMAELASCPRRGLARTGVLR